MYKKGTAERLTLLLDFLTLVFFFLFFLFLKRFYSLFFLFSEKDFKEEWHFLFVGYSYNKIMWVVANQKL